MFQSSGKKQLVVAACLLCGAFLSPSALAGPIGVSQINGAYQSTDLGVQPEFYPVTFSLTSGHVTGPLLLFGFSVPDLSVTINPPNPLSVSPITFELSNGPSDKVDFTINSSFLSGTDFIDAEMTLVPASNTTGFDFSPLNTALLSLDFSGGGGGGGGGGVSFDPHWAGFTGPVPFQITPTPEPASIVHLTWVGILGVVSYRRRHRRAACAGV